MEIGEERKREKRGREGARDDDGRRRRREERGEASEKGVERGAHVVVAEGKERELNQRARESVVVVVCGLPQLAEWGVLVCGRRGEEGLIGRAGFRRGGRKRNGGMESGVHEIERGCDFLMSEEGVKRVRGRERGRREMMIVPVPVCKSCRLGIGMIHIASSSVNPRTPMNQHVESSQPAVETGHIHPMCLHSLLRWPFHGVSLLCRTSGNSRPGSCLPTLAIRIESQSCLHLHISNRGRANRE